MFSIFVFYQNYYTEFQEYSIFSERRFYLVSEYENHYLINRIVYFVNWDKSGKSIEKPLKLKTIKIVSLFSNLLLCC